VRLRGLIGPAILLLVLAGSGYPVLAGSGLSGTVVDGSNDDRPVAGVALTLQTREATPRTVERTRSDSGGRYRFAAGGASTRNDAMVATYQGITYTQPISAGTTLHVFQTTRDDSQLVSQTTLVFVDLAAGAWQVLVWHKFSNLNTHAYVGPLHFTLPAGSRDFAPFHGASGVQQQGRTITYKAAILPGLDSGANYIYEYRLPYTGDDLPLALTTDYPTQTFCLSASKLVEVSAPTLTAGVQNKACTAPGGTFTVYRGTDLRDRGGLVAATLRPVRIQDISQNLGAQPGVRATALATGLVPLLAVLPLLRRRGSQDRGSKRGSAAAAANPRRAALVAEIAALDEAREVGSLDDQEHGARRRALVERALRLDEPR